MTATIRLQPKASLSYSERLSHGYSSGKITVLTDPLTHFDDQGSSRMVDVSQKDDSRRVAVARGTVRMQSETSALIQNRELSKGDVIGVARVAGIMAVKQTPNLIPMCHSIHVDSVDIAFEFTEENELTITATVGATDRTGVEMEALTCVTVSALTVYDMCKSVDKGMTIESVALVSKTGGKSGDFVRS